MYCGGFYVSADFLYWRAENHGFSYAYELKTTTPTGLNVGEVRRVNPEWEPAFRVGLGWNTKYDFWDVFLNYTWYRNHAKETKTSTPASTPRFIPMWPVFDSSVVSGQFPTVEASWRLLMNMGDLEVGRLTYLTSSLAIRPLMGVRGGTLHQKFVTQFSGGVSTVNDNFNGKNDYWGIGPRAGLNGEWHLNKGFSLIGNAATALLYGKTNVKTTHETKITGATAFSVEREYTDDFYQLVPNLQLLLGFQWQTCFWCEKMFFKVSTAWETNIWWDQFNLPFAADAFVAPFPTVGNQPLTMEGLTVNFEWDF